MTKCEGQKISGFGIVRTCPMRSNCLRYTSPATEPQMWLQIAPFELVLGQVECRDVQGAKAMSDRASKTRKRLMDCYNRQGGLCIWCGASMKLMCGLPSRKGVINAATYEHFYNRLSSLRRKYGNLGYAACHKCNSARGTFDNLLHKRGVDITDIWDRPDVSRLMGSPVIDQQGRP